MDISLVDNNDSAPATAPSNVTKTVVKTAVNINLTVSTEPLHFNEKEEEKGSASLQSQMVDGAIASMASLPEEVLRVTALQRQHSSQIAAVQREINDIQNQRSKVVEKSQEVRDEIESVKRQICLLEEESARRSRQCMKYKTEIMDLVRECELKQKALNMAQIELNTTKRQLEASSQKLDNFHTSFTSAEELSRIMEEIQQTEERLAALREKKEHMDQNAEETARICSGAVESELQTSIDELNTETDDVTKRVNSLQEEITSNRTKQNQVKQAITVLHKRNAAQLIRLKRQLKEQQLRHHQWQEQVRMLQSNIATLTQKLHSA